jgi:hypothetical protein
LTFILEPTNLNFKLIPIAVWKKHSLQILGSQFEIEYSARTQKLLQNKRLNVCLDAGLTLIRTKGTPYGQGEN